jgi:hypothetical protein
LSGWSKTGSSIPSRRNSQGRSTSHQDRTRRGTCACRICGRDRSPTRVQPVWRRNLSTRGSNVHTTLKQVQPTRRSPTRPWAS